MCLLLAAARFLSTCSPPHSFRFRSCDRFLAFNCLSCALFSPSRLSLSTQPAATVLLISCSRSNPSIPASHNQAIPTLTHCDLTLATVSGHSISAPVQDNPSSRPLPSQTRVRNRDRGSKQNHSFEKEFITTAHELSQDSFGPIK